MSAPKTALARLSDHDPRDRPREPVRAGAGGGSGGGGFGSLTPERARVLMTVAARPSAITLLVIFILVFGTLFAAGSSMNGSSGAIAAGWLAMHQVPLVIGKTGIGLWPLLPTGVMLWLVARECAQATEPDCTPADLGWIVGAAAGGPLLITAVCLAVADDAAAVVALQPPDTTVAFAWVLGLMLAAAAAGIVSRSWRELAELLPIPLPHWVIAGARAGARVVGRLLLVAAALTVLSFLLHWSRIADTYRAGGSFTGALGLTVLSLAYLPNVLVDAAGVLVGGQVQIGPGSLSLFAVEGAPVPAVPLAAAVPSGPAAVWWMGLLVVPAALGVLTGMECARTSTDRAAAPWATLTAAGVATVLLALLGVTAGGDLGTFGWIGPNVWLAAGAAFVWLAVAGYVGMLGARWFGPAAAPVAYAGAEDGYYEDDYYDEADDEYEDEFDDYEDDDAGDDAGGSGGGWYDESDHDDALEAELMDDHDELAHTPGDSVDHADIVDAEVVEGGHAEH
ncbi:DUF6350 family protein [Nocardia sp. NBC_00511]|uniref:cell division protein PerM n=1 Tax=Nocardia sp. NBC_00511 TaxID=2903591 RepID=UPI0030E258F7